MIKFSVVICLSSLLFSTSAKPYRPRVCPDPSCLFEQEEKDEKLFGKAVQNTVMFDHVNGKMIHEMKEVEPLEDMGKDLDIDPNMLIWKAVKEGIEQKYKIPEEDKDAVYHPFDIKHPADLRQPQNYQPVGHDRPKKYDRPEEDRDYLYHGRFNVAAKPMREEKGVIEGNVRPIYSSPEEDKDAVYHGHVKGHQPVQQPQPMNTFRIHPKRVHTQPEVDLDGVYHKH